MIKSVSGVFNLETPEEKQQFQWRLVRFTISFYRFTRTRRWTRRLLSTVSDSSSLRFPNINQQKWPHHLICVQSTLHSLYPSTFCNANVRVRWDAHQQSSSPVITQHRNLAAECNIGFGAAYGTAKSGVGIASMGVLRPDLIIKNVVPVIMAGIIGIYGLVVAVLVSDGRNSPTTWLCPSF